MKYKELVREISRESGYPQTVVRRILYTTTTVIGNSLMSGENISLISFGTFKVQEWKSRYIKNLVTGEYMETRPSRRVVFTASKELKDAIKDYDSQSAD